MNIYFIYNDTLFMDDIEKLVIVLIYPIIQYIVQCYPII